MDDIVLQIPSDWTNVVSAIIFEVVLITLVFFLTADVCARLNYLALVDGSVQTLVVMSPPLVGGGLISTSRKRTLFMITLRSMGIFLIFGTAFTIDGGTIDVIRSDTKKVHSPGGFSNLNMARDDKIKVVEKFINLRYSCTVSFNNSMLFGRLDEDRECEADIRVLRNAASIRADIEPTSVSFSGSCRHKNVTFLRKENFFVEYVVTNCEEGDRKATVFCFRTIAEGRLGITECMATLKLNETKFAVCEVFSEDFVAPSVSINTNCHPAANIDDLMDIWPGAMEITRIPSIIDMMAAASVARVQEREIEKIVQLDVTSVHRMWFLCLAIKLVLLAFLGVSSIYLRWRGAKRVLNDDRALLGLLRQKLDDWIGAGVSSRRKRSTIYLHLRTNEEGERNVWASSMPNYNTAVGHVEAEA